MPMTEKQLTQRDAKRDLGAELLQSVREMKARKDHSKGKPVFSRVTGLKDSRGK